MWAGDGCAECPSVRAGAARRHPRSPYMAGRPAPSMAPARSAACTAAVLAVCASLALLPGEAHGQEGGQVPGWVKQVFGFYVDGQISESELLSALKYLIDNGIMQVEAPEDRGIADRGDFYATYGPDPNSPYEAAAWLRDTRLLEDNAVWLSSIYKLPHDVEIAGAECGTVNAFYAPGGKAVTLCYELVDHLLDIGYELYGDDPDVAEDFAYNVLDGIVLHEAGHALVDVLDLPVTGLEEDAVDQFSALIQSRTYDDYDPYYDVGRIMMLDVADWWDYESQHGPSNYWDVHSLDEQRFYNIACYAYGADPEYNRDLVGIDYLHPSRAKTCPHEYEQMSSSWDRLLEGYLVE